MKEYGYLCWKIEVVETAMRERMDQRERAIFIRIYVRGYTFSQLRKHIKSGCVTVRSVRQKRQR